MSKTDFVAIFDADFQPEADYLWRTVPFLLQNPELALVQARWKFSITSLSLSLFIILFLCFSFQVLGFNNGAITFDASNVENIYIDTHAPPH